MLLSWHSAKHCAGSFFLHLFASSTEHFKANQVLDLVNTIGLFPKGINLYNTVQVLDLENIFGSFWNPLAFAM